MAEKKPLNPMAPTLEEAAKARALPRECLEEDPAAGTPQSPACERSGQAGREPEGRVPKGCDGEAAHKADGTLNLVHRASWLNLDGEAWAYSAARQSCGAKAGPASGTARSARPGV